LDTERPPDIDFVRIRAHPEEIAFEVSPETWIQLSHIP